VDREVIFEKTLRKFLAPVYQYIEDPTVTEVLINGTDEVYIEREGQLEPTTVSFDDEEYLHSVARNIAQYTNKRITKLTSRIDSRLPGGSRVHIVMPRCSRKGLCISIRKFLKHSFSLEGMVAGGTLSPEAKEYLEVVVDLEKNIIVSGGTGSGKTSLLNALSSKIPPTERIIVIEDSSELQLQQSHEQSHVLYFETAPADRHGQGAVSIRELFHSALRMRPDRIIIGECRGPEAMDLIQAMTSGHGGSMSTLHANSPYDALNRLETMATMAKLDIPPKALRNQMVSALNVIVQLARLDSGKRVITEISEVGKLDDQEQFQLTSLFRRGTRDGEDVQPGLIWTGKKSQFGPDLKQTSLTWRAQLTKEVFF
jgi:pilus assembly protein CpaF